MSVNHHHQSQGRDFLLTHTAFPTSEVSLRAVSRFMSKIIKQYQIKQQPPLITSHTNRPTSTPYHPPPHTHTHTKQTNLNPPSHPTPKEQSHVPADVKTLQHQTHLKNFPLINHLFPGTKNKPPPSYCSIKQHLSCCPIKSLLSLPNCP